MTDDGPDKHGSHHHSHRQQTLRCTAEGGVPVRRNPASDEGTGVVIKKGQSVPVLIICRS